MYVYIYLHHPTPTNPPNKTPQAAKLNIEVTSKPQAVDEIDRKLIQLEMAKISLENEAVRPIPCVAFVWGGWLCVYLWIGALG